MLVNSIGAIQPLLYDGNTTIVRPFIIIVPTCNKFVHDSLSQSVGPEKISCMEHEVLKSKKTH
jgi:hypothetical protein